MYGEQPLAESVAFVTGASSGIGRATATTLADGGADVALVARREERLDALAAEIERETDARALVLPADVGDEAEVEAAVNAAVDEFGRLDVVVSNAGVTRGGGQSISEFSTEDYRTVMRVNVDGTFFVTRATLPHLADAGGNVVYVGSFDGHYPRPQNPVYAASKWWVRGFAHSVEAQAGSDGVGVTLVNPAKVRTEISEGDDRTFAERFDPGEALEPQDVADAVAFAAIQPPRATVSELDLYTRDKYAREGF